MEAAQKPVEILIHNVSHKDLLMSVCRAEDTVTRDDCDDRSWKERCRRAKPAFSAFNPISRVLYRQLDPQQGGTVAASAGDLLECPAVDTSGAETAEAGSPTIVTGFRLQLPPKGQPLQFSSSQQPTARPLTQADLVLASPLPPPATPPRPAAPAASDEEEEDRDGLAVTAVYFPLISVLVPKWLEISYDKSCRQRVYLISGSCTPRDPDADMADNSTEVRFEPKFPARFSDTSLLDSFLLGHLWLGGRVI